MKKSEELLFKTATKFMKRYASPASDYIQQAVANAAKWGTHGIMNFPEQLKQDQATLSITVSKEGLNVSVSNPTVNPGWAAPNYSRLPEQIKNYLEKYLELFPKDDTDNKNLVLQYSGVNTENPIAKQ